jgi:hypothetical protein
MYMPVYSYESPSDEEIMAAIAYRLRQETYEVFTGGVSLSSFQGTIYQWKTIAHNIADYVLRENILPFFFSGLIGESLFMRYCFESNNYDYYCFEGWVFYPGSLIVSRNSPAMSYPSVSMQNIIKTDSAARNSLISKFAQYDKYNLQHPLEIGNLTVSEQPYISFQNTIVPSTSLDNLRKICDSPLFIVVAPNVVGDSSTMCGETIFKSMREWLRFLYEYSDNLPYNISFLVRYHPAEYKIGSKLKYSLFEWAQANLNSKSNFINVSPSTDINIMHLIPFSLGVLPWMGTPGAEFVARGKPCVCAALPKYSFANLYPTPMTLDSYIRQLNLIITRQILVSNEDAKRAQAYLAYVFGEMSFTAHTKQYISRGWSSDSRTITSTLLSRIRACA